jgi:hypothetical protein
MHSLRFYLSVVGVLGGLALIFLVEAYAAHFVSGSEGPTWLWVPFFIGFMIYLVGCMGLLVTS